MEGSVSPPFANAGISNSKNLTTLFSLNENKAAPMGYPTSKYPISLGCNAIATVGKMRILEFPPVDRPRYKFGIDNCAIHSLSKSQISMLPSVRPRKSQSRLKSDSRHATCPRTVCIAFFCAPVPMREYVVRLYRVSMTARCGPCKCTYLTPVLGVGRAKFTWTADWPNT